MTASPLRFSALLAALGLVLASASGCPPVREQVDEGTGGGGDYYQTAFFLLDPWTGNEYELAYLYLVDSEDMNCQRIINNYGIDWWNLSSDVQWVQSWVYKGAQYEWEGAFQSQYAWNQEGNFDYTQADFFSGTFGDGGYDEGDDDDDVPPPVGDPEDPDGDGNSGRDQEGEFGTSAIHMDDALTFTSWSNDVVRGYISSEAGEWSFDAENCGLMDGGAVIGITGDAADER